MGWHCEREPLSLSLSLYYYSKMENVAGWPRRKSGWMNSNLYATARWYTGNHSALFGTAKSPTVWPHFISSFPFARWLSDCEWNRLVSFVKGFIFVGQAWLTFHWVRIYQHCITPFVSNREYEENAPNAYHRIAFCMPISSKTVYHKESANWLNTQYRFETWQGMCLPNCWRQAWIEE